MGELYNRLKELEYEDILPMHMPGAKRNKALVSMPDAVRMDITEITGFDNLHHADGIIKDCADRAAKLYGADEALLLVNGSTAGILAAICGSTHSGDYVAVARNVHRSVTNALYLGHLNPIYIMPELKNAEAGIYGQIGAAQVEAVFKNSDKSIKAVIITSPTYEGVVSDIAAIAEVAHKNGAVLIVDEAHGAHFGMHEAFPANAISQGADVVIVSLHKTLPAFTQTALLLMKSTMNQGCSEADNSNNHEGKACACDNHKAGPDSARIRMYWDMMQSTSPSYLLMGSIDNCISIIEENGRELFEAYVQRLVRLREEIGRLSYIRLMPTDDISKIVLLVNDAPEFARRLRDIYKIELEMASEKYVIAMTSIGDTDEGYVRFIQALRNMDEPKYELEDIWRDEAHIELLINKSEGQQDAEQISGSTGQMTNSSTGHMKRFNVEVYKQLPQIKMSIYEALNAESEFISLDGAAGRVAAAPMCVYPPGINLVNPGEVISTQVIEVLNEGINQGLEVLGVEVDDEDLHRRVLVIRLA